MDDPIQRSASAPVFASGRAVGWRRPGAASILVVALSAVLAATLTVQWPALSEASLADTSAGARPQTASLPPEPTIYDTSIPGCVADVSADLEFSFDEVEPPTLPDVAAGVEEVRDLEFKEKVPTTLLPSDELSEVAGEQMLGKVSKRRNETQSEILVASGLAPPGTDVEKITRSVVEQEIAGFYLPREKRIYAPRNGDELTALDEVILAHEYEHALADQALGLPKLLRPMRRADETGAARTLVEGDAQLTSIAYARANMSPERLGDLMLSSEKAAAATSDIPHFFRRSVEFPYTEGLMFACHLYEKGGWAAIDAAYDDPPRSTLEILYPLRYGKKQFAPVDPKDPQNPAGWKKFETSSFGAADLMFMFEAPGGGDVVAYSSESIDMVWGWAGGELKSWTKGPDVAVALTLVDRPPNPVPEYVPLCKQLWRWVPKAFDTSLLPTRVEGPLVSWEAAGRHIVLGCEGGLVRLAVAPRLETATDLATLSRDK